MRIEYLKILVFGLMLFTACSSPKVMTSLKTNAETFEQSGNYTEALSSWEQYFSQIPLEEIPGADFARAAKTAFKAGRIEKAIVWFDQARYKNYAAPEMYETLASIFKEQNNLSKELSALEYYVENYGTDNQEINISLFEIYTEIGELDKAQAYWNFLDTGSCAIEKNMVKFLEVNNKLGETAISDSLASEILKINPEQTEALDWLAKKYYWAGQNRYNSEMKKYEENKTRKQYNILLKELDRVTSDFKKALPYLEKLWKQNPGKEYAGYFANIYARFGDEKKVDYYQKYMNQ